MDAKEKKELALFAVKIREGIVRSTHAAKSGHPGGSLSSAESLTQRIRSGRIATALFSRKDTAHPDFMPRLPMPDFSPSKTC